jgi:hypothetical protein
MLTLRRRVTPLQVFLILLPIVSLALWLSSGLETLTKQSRAVEIEMEDTLFGDTATETRLVPGPFFGYYIGLDVVALTAALSLLTLGSIGFYHWMTRQTRLNPGKEGIV